MSFARQLMRFETKGWYEAERGLDARGGPDAWRGNQRPGAGAIELRHVVAGDLVLTGSFCRRSRETGRICPSN